MESTSRPARWLLLTLLPALLFAAPAAARPAAGMTAADGRGIVLLIGGGLQPDSADIYAAIRPHIARRKFAFVTEDAPIRLLVVPTSKASYQDGLDAFEKDDPEDPVHSPSYRTWFTRLGFEPILLPIAIDLVRKDPRLPWSQALIGQVRSCPVIFFQGGDQARDAACLLTPDGRPTPLLDAIRGVYDAGGVVFGTSAGAHFLCSPMDGFGVSYESLLANGLETFPLERVLAGEEIASVKPDNSIGLPGFGLLPPHVLTDTHFGVRGRFGRMLVAMRDLHKTLGIGLDENTALSVEGSVGTVLGERGVFVAQARPGCFPVSATGFAARDLRFSYLTRGDRIDLRTGAVTPSKPEALRDGPPVEEMADIFSAETDRAGERTHPYQLTELLRRLARSGGSVAVGTTLQADPAFVLRFERIPGSGAFWRSDAAFTLAGLRLDVTVRPAGGRK